jgi:hypothetical protein
VFSVDSCSLRRRPLRSPFFGLEPLSIFYHARPHPLQNQTNEPFVAYPVPYEFLQMIMPHFVEERPNVEIQYVVHLPLRDSGIQRVQCIVLAAPRPESIRKIQKILFPDLVDNFHHRLLEVEVALSVILLVSAGLLLRSLAELRRLNPGVQVDSILTVGLSLPEARYSNREQMSGLARRLLANLRELQAVRSAGLITCLPVGGYCGDRIFNIEGRPKPPGEFRCCAAEVSIIATAWGLMKNICMKALF